MKRFIPLLLLLLALLGLAAPALAAEGAAPETSLGFNGSTLTVILGALLALSEILALTPIRSNAIFQLIVNVLRSLDFTGEKAQARARVLAPVGGREVPSSETFRPKPVGGGEGGGERSE